MLALTKKTDYALIALAYLARSEHAVMSARELGLSSGVPLPILTNILKTLAQAGMVESERGAAGGYVLARSPKSITLHEVIAVIEGPPNFVQCAAHGDARGERCELEPHCTIRLPAHRVHGRLKEFLESVTLAELVDEPRVTVGLPGRDGERMGLQHGSVKELAS